MIKNHKLAKSISDAAWDQFAQWLQYFGKIYGKKVIAVAPVSEMLNFDTKLYLSRYSKTNQVKSSTKHEFLKPMNNTNFLTHTSLKIATLI